MALSSPQRSGPDGVVHPTNTEQQQQQQQQEEQHNSSAAAAATVQLLLQEDPLLTQHKLHEPTHSTQDKNDEAHVCAYAAALLQVRGDEEDHVETRATAALEDVQRKLTLVESLAERVSRTSPEAVAGPLLQLHGYTLLENSSNNNNDDDEEQQQQQSLTLTATREKCHRLERQGVMLEGVVHRVESSLDRGLTRMQIATCRLQRVLDLNLVLKQILRLLFESNKLKGYDLDDVRDLTRAAASVAILQDLLSQPELSTGTIDVVEAMRPNAYHVANQVKNAAANLLQQFHQSKSSSSVAVHLGATLQVYYHLGELPRATWISVRHGLDAAEQAMQELLRGLSTLQDTAAAQAKAAVGPKHKPGETERALQKKLRELRADAAATWATHTLDAARLVWNLHHVQCRKSDPVTRRVFCHVVAEAPIPNDILVPPEQQQQQNDKFSVFGIYWYNLCVMLKTQLNQVLEEEGSKFKSRSSTTNVAAMYPAVRAAALDTLLSSLYDTMQAGSFAGLSLQDTSSTSSSSGGGVLGGSAGLQDSFLNCSSGSNFPQGTDPHALVVGTATADTWTRVDTTAPQHGSLSSLDRLFSTSSTNNSSGATTTLSMSAIFQSPEWQALQGNDESWSGLYGLQQAFLQASRDRLCEPLQYMFPSSGVTMDEDGHAISVLPTLPSRYDLQKLDQSIRQELALADPREGGGELSMVSMICNVIVDMVQLFCHSAKGVVSGAGQAGYLVSSSPMAPTNDLLHDLKVSKVMNALAVSVRSAPENTFVAPYRPATLVQHEEAANKCRTALLPALAEIEQTVKTLILTPLCRALNQRVADAIAKVHHGTYLSESLEGMEGSATGTSFVQKHLAELYEGMAETILSKLPKEHAGIVACTVATFSIYIFVSNIAMIRPLGETARLHITQDLADFELALEQLVFKANSSTTLSHMHHGRPYAELRAVRQMLFWTGLEDPTLSVSGLTKSLLREAWIKDVRPSTVIHFLFSFAPPLLSSPHHAKRTSPETYVMTLVELDGSIEDGEASAWMVTMECCDSYQQRESVGHSAGGDARVAAILMSLGPELLRRYRH